MAAQTALKSKPTIQLPIQEALIMQKQRNFASVALKTSTMYPYKRKRDCKPQTQSISNCPWVIISKSLENLIGGYETYILVPVLPQP